MKTSLRSLAVLVMALAMFTLPALANIIKKADATPTCQQYTLNVSGIYLTPKTANVSYTITLTPTAGTPIIISDTMTVTKTSSGGNFSGTTTQLWSKYGITLNADYVLTGTATLDVSDGNTVSIVFSPTSINCVNTQITSASASVTCTQFTLTVSGTGLTTSTATVTYTITLTPTSGSPITITGSLTVTNTGSGNFTGTVTQLWSTFGVTLNSNYNLAGSVSLGSSNLPITFSPNPLNCSAPPAGCLPSSSLSVLINGKTVTSYAPDGNWAAPSTYTGIQVVGLEPPATGVNIPTPHVVNSCSSNSTTGQTVCVGNNTDVYLLSGSTLNTTLNSGANANASFSGGLCENCGVAINAGSNTALITMGIKSAPSGSGFQFLNLATNAFSTPIPADHEVSEDIVWDNTRSLILSPDEEGYYELFQTGSSGTTEYSNNLQFGEGDSAAEDCTTGIALATLEYTDRIYITDLTQATYTSGSPGNWTAPGQIQTFSDFSYWGQSGNTGIAVAPSSHLAIVTSEFTGRGVGVLQLPSTSGSGTPGVVDFASAEMPNTPDGNNWHEGWDPHTVTAYVSPNNGKAYGVMADAAPPNYLAIIDLQAFLNAPRIPGTHTIEPTYDLVGNGVIVYVAAH